MEIIRLPHDDRPLMKPQPICDFNQVFEAISSQPSNEVSDLLTTGGVPFNVHAKISPAKGRFLSLPHGNRIYSCCWGNTSNHMGKEEGQRISQYARPIDEWCQNYETEIFESKNDED